MMRFFYERKKLTVLVFSVSTLLALFFPSLPLFFFLYGFCTLLFLLPPVSRCGRFLLPEQRCSLARISFYGLSLSASLGITVSMVLMEAESGLLLLPPAVLLPASLLCLCLGMGLTRRIMDRRGIFRGCIFLILLCEAALILLSSLQNPFSAGFGTVFLLLSAGGVWSVFPSLLLAFYGRIGYLAAAFRLSIFFLSGLACSFFFCHLALEGKLSAEEPAIFLLCLLVFSFFCIFFAWKQRFVILKNEII